MNPTSFAECRLYTFVDTAYLHGKKPDAIAQQLCDGGSDIIQLRAKNSSPEEIQKMAEEILPITRRAGIPLVINDHLQIAQEIGAEFCHLGQEDFFGETGNAEHGRRINKGENFESAFPVPRSELKHVSQLKLCRSRGDEAHSLAANQSLLTSAPANIKIGLSTHAPVQAERAIAAGADYIAIGPIYATGTKPTAKPVTLDYVRWAAANVKIPWFAIGGINLQNLDEVLAAGAKKFCVVSAILNSENIAQTCREFRKQLERNLMKSNCSDLSPLV